MEIDYPIDYSGYLQKKGSKSFDKYKKRWFELSGSRLFYYKKKTANAQPQGVLLLKGCKIERDEKRKFGFTISGKHLKRTYLLQALSEAEFNGWLQELQRATGTSCEEKIDHEETKNEAKKETSEIYNSDTSPKKITLDDFDLLCVVGRGAYGKVMKVRKKDTKEILAMKILSKEMLKKQGMVSYTKTERNILQKIKHPFIVTLRYAFQNDAKLYFVLEFLSGGELFYHMSQGEGRFSEDVARFYAAELVLALGHLHENNIVYRDLKPENIVLDREGHAKLTDFGLSKEDLSNKDVTHTFCGTPEYLAPEVIQGQGYSNPVDWWSLGILLYEMICGLPPFYSENMSEMYSMILDSPPQFPNFMSKEARDCIERLLDKNPKIRLGSDGDAKEIMNHPFFKPIDFQKLYNRGYEPPIKPKIDESDDSAANFDPEFTSERPIDSFVIVRKKIKDFDDWEDYQRN